MQPAERSPIGISDFKQAHREENYRSTNDQRKCDPTPNFQLRTSNFRLRSVLPPQPKEKGDEKRNEPAVAVLVVQAPFAAKVTATNKPEGAESEGEE